MANALLNLRQVQLEITNQCGYAHMHPKCPASKVTAPDTLEAEIVFRVFDWLGEHGYEGEVIFSIYNEPMTDPRLFWFIQELDARAPKCSVYVITNGWNLDQKMLDDLRKICKARVLANGYTEDGQKRLGCLEGQVQLRSGHLDDRINIYDREPSSDGGVCHAPLRNLTIWSTGDVGLCCRDWKHTVTFGNLHDQTPDAIFNSPERLGAIVATEAGERGVIPLCSRCARRWSE